MHRPSNALFAAAWLAYGMFLSVASKADDSTADSAQPPRATAEATPDPTAGTAEKVLPAASDTEWLGSLRSSADALQWTDTIIRHDWRLQHRPGSDAFRILDPADRVVQEGTREACLEAFSALEHSGQMPAVSGPTVIVLHGLGEGRRSMRPLVEYLRSNLDSTVLSFGYASTGAGIDDHGRALATVIAGLPATDEISFVGHSLGNLVVRRWMGLAVDGDLARVHRMVMLGPPNQGSELARRVAKIGMLVALSNGAARELVLDWNRVSPNLAVPSCPFGIVAGGKGDGRGYSSFLAGDDDAVVRVEETTLAGAGDFLLVPVRHSAMMKAPAVQQATAAFLETGQFAPPPTPESP